MHTRIEVRDASQVGEARRLAAHLGQRARLSEAEIGDLGIVLTEAATNVLKHGGGGEMLLRVLGDGPRRGVEMLALDAGPGIADVTRSMRDGISTAGSAGNGLGAISRLAQEFDIYSASGKGTAVLARIWARESLPTRNGHLGVGAICVAKRGQEVSGDAWDVAHAPERCAVVVADGLGHGPSAAEASTEAVRLFRTNPWSAPEETIDRIHRGLRATRGAAVAVALIERSRNVVRYAGLGNITGHVIGIDGKVRNTVSHHGTAGHDVRKIGEFQYPFSPGNWLVMYSDGLGTHWDIDGYAGLRQRHATLVAGVLYRDHERGRDDTTVVMVREKA